MVPCSPNAHAGSIVLSDLRAVLARRAQLDHNGCSSIRNKWRDTRGQNHTDPFPTACVLGADSDRPEMEVFLRHTIEVALDGVGGSVENVPHLFMLPARLTAA